MVNPECPVRFNLSNVHVHQPNKFYLARGIECDDGELNELVLRNKISVVVSMGLALHNSNRAISWLEK